MVGGRLCVCYAEPEPAEMECWAPGAVPTVISTLRQYSVADNLLATDAAYTPNVLQNDSDLRSVQQQKFWEFIFQMECITGF